MRSSAQSTPTPPPVPPAIDLSKVTEATRRALYDAVVAVHFSPTPEEIREAKREGEWYPRHSPDECRVTVLYLAGRWFTFWRIWDLDDDSGDDVPEAWEWSISRVEANPSMPYGVEFFEV
jgi:hypothetical protein